MGMDGVTQSRTYYAYAAQTACKSLLLERTYGSFKPSTYYVYKAS